LPAASSPEDRTRGGGGSGVALLGHPNRLHEDVWISKYPFLLAVLEAQGGMSTGADAAVRAVAAVASREGREPGTVRREMLHRIAVIVAGGSAARIARRRATVSGARAS